MSEIERDMHAAAFQAARTAAGRAFGERVAAAHPGLPAVDWYADDFVGVWEATGHVTVDDDDEVRRIVGVYAKALGGSAPHEVDRDEVGCEFETTATFEGVKVTIWGVIMDFAS